MKFDSKGFTLVELLAVMVILISISLVVVGNITESLTRRENKEKIEQQELAIGAAKIYFSLENQTCVTVEILREKDYFKNMNKFDLLNATDIIKIFCITDEITKEEACEYRFYDELSGENCN